MLLCNNVFVTATSTSSCTSLPRLCHCISRLAYCVLVVLVSVLLLLIVVVVHLMPVTATLASRRWAGRIATAPVAALVEGTEEADFPGVNLCLLCLMILKTSVWILQIPT